MNTYSSPSSNLDFFENYLIPGTFIVDAARNKDFRAIVAWCRSSLLPGDWVDMSRAGEISIKNKDALTSLVLAWG